MLIRNWIDSIRRGSRRPSLHSPRLWREGRQAAYGLGQVQCLEDRTLLTVLLFEDFEDAAVTYSTNVPDDLSDRFSGDLYGRITQTEMVDAGLEYESVQGDSFYVSQDTDSTFVNPTNTVQLDWTGIDISGETGLELSIFVAESGDEFGPEHWDQDSSVIIQAQTDSGGFFPIFAIESDSLFSPNEAPRVDLDFDGDGDGTTIIREFTQFSTPIPPGSTLDLRLTISRLNGFGEDIAFDNILLTSFDPVPPTVTVNVVDGSLVESDNSSEVTFDFSTDVFGFDASDVTVTGGALSNFASTSGSSYTATFTASDGVETTGSVSVEAGYFDGFGTIGGTASDSVSIDTLNPTVSVNIVDASLNDGDLASQVTFEFSENVTGFDASDVSTGNGSLSGFSAIDGNSYTATFTATDNVAGAGTVTVGTGFVDGSGNTGIGGSDSVSVDPRDPVITASLTATPSGPLTSGETINYTASIANNGATNATGVVFSDPLDSNTTLVNGSIKVTPIAFDDGYWALIGSTLTVSDAASGLLGNDVDPTVGGGAARLDLTAQPVRDSGNSTAPAGTLSVNLSDGTFTYSPSASAASGQIEVFTYNIVDAESLNAVETGVITFTTVYGVAVDDAYESLGNVGIEVDAANGVLANDTNATSIGLLAGAQHGSVNLSSDGSFTYTPPAGMTGFVDTFTYTIGDSGGDVGTVSIMVDEMIWFIDNSFGLDGDGTFADPFGGC